MGHKVHANGLEVACKASDGTTPAAFPDICKTPAPPGVPVPLPYPNTALASDTDKASKHIKIHKKPVMLGRKSRFKTSTGDEPGSVGGVGSNTVKGAAMFVGHSMNVKFEGEPAVRNLDLTTHNHAASGQPGNTVPWPFLAGTFAAGVGTACDTQNRETAGACNPWTSHEDKCKPTEQQRQAFLDAKAKKDGIREQLKAAKKTDKDIEGDAKFIAAKKKWNQEADRMADAVAADPCASKLRCYLSPKNKKESKCCPGLTGHHLVPASALLSGRKNAKGPILVAGIGPYDPEAAPCICAEGENQTQGTHGIIHVYQSTAAGYVVSGETYVKRPEGALAMADGSTYNGVVTTYAEARDQGVEAALKTFPQSGCNAECLKAQLDAYHRSVGIKDDTPCKAVVTGRRGKEAHDEADMAVKARVDAIQARSSAEQKGSFP